jgi:hypothetical protein
MAVMKVNQHESVQCPPSHLICAIKYIDGLYIQAGVHYKKLVHILDVIPNLHCPDPTLLNFVS